MKKILIATFCAAMFLLTACGGVYSVSSGRADIAEISFVADKSYPITVTIDDEQFTMLTVKEKSYKRDRQFKKKAENTIQQKPGKHKVVVTVADGNVVYEQLIFVSANEHKIIRL